VAVSPTRKLAVSVASFLAAAGLVAIAAAGGSVAPLFLAWIPLLGVPWILTRPDPVEVEPRQDMGHDEGPERAERELGPFDENAPEPGGRPGPDGGALGTGRRPGRDPEAP
jgi:hypothetical protein